MKLYYNENCFNSIQMLLKEKQQSKTASEKVSISVILG